MGHGMYEILKLKIEKIKGVKSCRLHSEVRDTGEDNIKIYMFEVEVYFSEANKETWVKILDILNEYEFVDYDEYCKIRKEM